MALPERSDALRTRRSILAAAAGGAAAIAASAVRPASVDAAPTAMMTETDNIANAPTAILNQDANEAAFIAVAAGTGTGLEGASGNGVGVFGGSADSSNPGSTPRNAGVVGAAGDNSGMPNNIALTGVFGYAQASPTDGFVGSGVWGNSPDVGVVGTGGIGVEGLGFWGVLGLGGGGTNAIGLYGAQEFPSGRALYVEGRAEFTRSGRATVVSGASSKVINHAGVTPSSLVFAVMNTNESGRWVRAVVPGSGKFTVYFNAALQSAAAIVWIVFTNPSNHSG